MPVYNAAPTLPEALDSVARQHHADWELVAVDDGSTDDSAGILAAAAARDERVRMLRRPHEGLVAALSAGLAVCRGERLARFDADDRMHPERLARQAAAAFDGVLGCGVHCFPEESIREGFARYEAWLNSLLTHEQIVADLFVESPLAHPSVMLPTTLLRAVGGYRDAGWPEDYDLWLRLWRHGARFAKLPEVLLEWRDHPGRLSRGGGAYTIRAFRDCKLHHLQATFLHGVPAVTLWGAGEGGKVWSRALGEVGIRVVRHVDIDPRKIGGRVRGAPVVPPEALTDGCPEPILVAVGVKGARGLIRAHLSGLGKVDGQDYVCVA
ncbi:MAG: glycosyltransferase family 2 protein [Armatimonadetes bacterium]|nr:glycosyltransferase family 2 protein [Armatimonadota bacterium]